MYVTFAHLQGKKYPHFHPVDRRGGEQGKGENVTLWVPDLEAASSLPLTSHWQDLVTWCKERGNYCSCVAMCLANQVGASLRTSIHLSDTVHLSNILWKLKQNHVCRHVLKNVQRSTKVRYELLLSIIIKARVLEKWFSWAV